MKTERPRLSVRPAFLARFAAVTRLYLLLALAAFAAPVHSEQVTTSAETLVGHWPLLNDARDRSPQRLHGEIRGGELQSSGFSGLGQWVEIPTEIRPSFGSRPFSLSLWLWTKPDLDDAWGDLVSCYDSKRRTGFQWSLVSSSAGYNSAGNSRQIQFSIDRDLAGEWTDCGRPGGVAHSSDALTVYRDQLFAGTSDAADEAQWCHVYRYQGAAEWVDCGRLGNGRTRGVYAMVVHDGALIAATSASHGPQPASMDFGRVYRYRGDHDWEDLGQPGKNYRLNSLASYRGQLYVCGFNIGPEPGHCYRYEGNQQWRECGEFRGWPHAMTVHDGLLYVAYPQGEVFSYDTQEWRALGNPFGTLPECNQIHSLGVFAGCLWAGTWPKGRIAFWRDGAWIDAGRPGDATEVIGLANYRGSLYAATIPRAEVFRMDGVGEWRSLRRLFDPPGFEPVPVGSTDWGRISDWSRATSITVYRGRLLASTGTCHRTNLENARPNEPRGRVWSYHVDGTVTVDHDIGPGWHHLVATRNAGELRIYVDGKLAAREPLRHPDLDLHADVPLKIGSGTQDSFQGRIRDLKWYARDLADDEVAELARQRPEDSP